MHPDGEESDGEEMEGIAWARMAEPEFEPNMLSIRYVDPAEPDKEIVEEVFYDSDNSGRDGQSRLLVKCSQVLQLNEVAKSLRSKLEFCRESLKRCRKDYYRELQLLRGYTASAASDENVAPPKVYYFRPGQYLDDVTNKEVQDFIHKSMRKLQEENDELKAYVLTGGSADFRTSLESLLQKNPASVLIDTIMRLDPIAKEASIAMAEEESAKKEEAEKESQAQDAERIAAEEHAEKDSNDLVDGGAKASAVDTRNAEEVALVNEGLLQELDALRNRCAEMEEENTRISAELRVLRGDAPSAADGTQSIGSTEAPNSLGADEAAGNAPCKAADAANGEKVEGEKVSAETDSAHMLRRIQELEGEVKLLKASEHLAPPRKHMERASTAVGMSRSEHHTRDRSRASLDKVKMDQEAKLLQSLKIDHNAQNSRQEKDPQEGGAAAPFSSNQKSQGNLGRTRAHPRDRKIHQALLQSSYKALELDRQWQGLKEELVHMRDLTMTTVQEHKRLLEQEIEIADTDPALTSPDMADTVAHFKAHLLHVHGLLEASADNACKTRGLQPNSEAHVEAQEFMFANRELDACAKLLQAALRTSNSSSLDLFLKAHSGRKLVHEQHADLVPKVSAIKVNKDKLKLQKDMVNLQKKELEEEMAKIGLGTNRNSIVGTPSTTSHTAVSSAVVSRQGRRYSNPSLTNGNSPRTRSGSITSVPDPRAHRQTAKPSKEKVCLERMEGLQEPSRAVSRGLPEPVRTASRGLPEPVRTASRGLPEPVRTASRGLPEPVRTASRGTRWLVEPCAQDNGNEFLFDIKSTQHKAEPSRMSSHGDLGFPDGEDESMTSNLVTKSCAVARNLDNIDVSGRDKMLTRRLNQLSVPSQRRFGDYVARTVGP